MQSIRFGPIDMPNLRDLGPDRANARSLLHDVGDLHRLGEVSDDAYDLIKAALGEGLVYCRPSGGWLIRDIINAAREKAREEQKTAIFIFFDVITRVPPNGDVEELAEDHLRRYDALHALST